MNHDGISLYRLHPRYIKRSKFLHCPLMCECLMKRMMPYEYAGTYSTTPSLFSLVRLILRSCFLLIFFILCPSITCTCDALSSFSALLFLFSSLFTLASVSSEFLSARILSTSAFVAAREAFTFMESAKGPERVWSLVEGLNWVGAIVAFGVTLFDFIDDVRRVCCTFHVRPLRGTP